MDDKTLLELAARQLQTPAALLTAIQSASSDIHGIGNACMFRDSCRAMAARVAELEAALRPFAEFHPSLLEWRTGGGWPIQEAWREHQAVGLQDLSGG